MTDRDPALTPEEEALLDFSLGLRAPEESPGTEAHELRGLVEATRRACRQADGAAEEAVSGRDERVLAVQAAAQAEGEPSFWRLLEGGLRTNMWLRLVAASLVVHLAALPVLAWFSFTERERPPLFINFEKPEPVLVDDPAPELLEPLSAEELPELLEGLDQAPGTSDD